LPGRSRALRSRFIRSDRDGLTHISVLPIRPVVRLVSTFRLLRSGTLARALPSKDGSCCTGFWHTVRFSRCEPAGGSPTNEKPPDEPAAGTEPEHVRPSFLPPFACQSKSASSAKTPFSPTRGGRHQLVMVHPCSFERQRGPGGHRCGQSVQHGRGTGHSGPRRDSLSPR
jgi:hypothetical protein